MKFEFDSLKSDSNLIKHGIDFVNAQLLWADPNRIQIPAKEIDEPRFMIIGKIDGKHWSAICTHREDNVRIISIRRSRDEEINIYES